MYTFQSEESTKGLLMTLTFMLFVITQHYLYVKITALAFNHVIAKKYDRTSARYASH